MGFVCIRSIPIPWLLKIDLILQKIPTEVQIHTLSGSSFTDHIAVLLQYYVTRSEKFAGEYFHISE